MSAYLQNLSNKLVLQVLYIQIYSKLYHTIKCYIQDIRTLRHLVFTPEEQKTEETLRHDNQLLQGGGGGGGTSHVSDNGQ